MRTITFMSEPKGRPVACKNWRDIIEKAEAHMLARALARCCPDAGSFSMSSI